MNLKFIDILCTTQLGFHVQMSKASCILKHVRDLILLYICISMSDYYRLQSGIHKYRIMFVFTFGWNPEGLLYSK